LPSSSTLFASSSSLSSSSMSSSLSSRSVSSNRSRICFYPDLQSRKFDTFRRIHTTHLGRQRQRKYCWRNCRILGSRHRSGDRSQHPYEAAMHSWINCGLRSYDVLLRIASGCCRRTLLALAGNSGRQSSATPAARLDAAELVSCGRTSRRRLLLLVRASDRLCKVSMRQRSAILCCCFNRLNLRNR
jgi:hypothetical protein